MNDTMPYLPLDPNQLNQLLPWACSPASSLCSCWWWWLGSWTSAARARPGGGRGVEGRRGAMGTSCQSVPGLSCLHMQGRNMRKFDNSDNIDKFVFQFTHNLSHLLKSCVFGTLGLVLIRFYDIYTI